MGTSWGKREFLDQLLATPAAFGKLPFPRVEPLPWTQLRHRAPRGLQHFAEPVLVHLSGGEVVPGVVDLDMGAAGYRQFGRMLGHSYLWGSRIGIMIVGHARPEFVEAVQRLNAVAGGLGRPGYWLCEWRPSTRSSGEVILEPVAFPGQPVLARPRMPITDGQRRIAHDDILAFLDRHLGRFEHAGGPVFVTRSVPVSVPKPDSRGGGRLMDSPLPPDRVYRDHDARPGVVELHWRNNGLFDADHIGKVVAHRLWQEANVAVLLAERVNDDAKAILRELSRDDLDCVYYHRRVIWTGTDAITVDPQDDGADVSAHAG